MAPDSTAVSLLQHRCRCQHTALRAARLYCTRPTRALWTPQQPDVRRDHADRPMVEALGGECKVSSRWHGRHADHLWAAAVIRADPHDAA